MKKIAALLTALALILGLCACSQSAATWQEQYDLGVRYLSEGNYQEAIIAFTAAIEIDPKQADAYIGLADAYIGIGDYTKASEAIAQGKAACGDDESFDRILNNLSFLETGESGIKITSFYFDKEAYLAGSQTDFLVSVAYRCPEGEDCILMIGANTNEPYSFAMMDEDYQVTGSGGYQFHVSVMPVQWEESYFGIYVNLSEIDHAETWTPFAMDVLYINPQGEIVGSQLQSSNLSDGEVLNAYGATEFTHRQDYRVFDDLSLEQQQSIIEMAEIAQTGDYEAMMEAAQKNVDGSGAGSLTIWNGYKIEYSFPYSLDGEHDSHSCGITIRPENGMGYDLYVWYWTNKTDGSYHCDVNIASCPCVDWQWNGEYNGKRISQYISKDPNHESYNEMTETGTIVNGLRHGEFYCTHYGLSDYEDNKHWTDTESRTDIIDTYDMGVCILQNGEVAENNYITTWDGAIGGQSMDDQWMKDEVYW